MKKSLCFVFPYREISGVPVLFYNLANSFAQYFKDKYNVSVLDYSDGVMSNYITKDVSLKVIETGKPCVLDDDYIVMQGILPSAMRPECGYLTLGQNLYEGKSANGEAYNFGPRAEQTKTVFELTQDLAEKWGIDKSKASKIIGNIPFEETKLLKLNCDKDLAYLHWHSTLHYEQCVKVIAE